MKKVCVVTEGQTDALILKSLLPKELVRQTEFVVSAGRYSAQSRARSILAARRLPVALVLDADTTDSLRVQEQMEFLRELVAQASGGIAYEVFLAVPVIEVLLLEQPALLAALSPAGTYPAELDFARLQPRQFLSRLLGEENPVVLVKKLLSKLTPAMIAEIQEHPLIHGLSNFLSTVIYQSEPVAAA